MGGRNRIASYGRQQQTATAEELRQMVELLLELDADTLRGHRLFHVLIEIIVVRMVVSLQTDLAAARQLVFQIKLTHKHILLVRVDAVAITEITIDQQPVVKQLAAQQHLHLCLVA